MKNQDLKPFIGIIVALVLTAGGVWIYAQKGASERSGWKPCKGLPPITQTGTFSGNLKVTPTNAPCYIDITATAKDDQGNMETSEPVRIYIRK